MGLLAPAEQDKLRETFNEMTSPVRLLFFTQTLDCETCPQARQILDELPLVSDKVTIEELNVVIDKEKAAQYGIDRAPAIAVLAVDPSGGTHDSRIRFMGAPAGYEFISLVRAVLLVGGHGSSLTDEQRAKLAAVEKPVTMQVFTTPT